MGLSGDARPDAVFHGRDYTFSVQRAIFTEYDGRIDLNCLVRADWINPWLPTPGLNQMFQAEDDLGNVYVNAYDIRDHGDRYCGGGQMPDTPCSACYMLWVTGIPPSRVIFFPLDSNCLYFTPAMSNILFDAIVLSVEAYLSDMYTTSLMPH